MITFSAKDSSYKIDVALTNWAKSNKTMNKLWKVTCQEDVYPGMWQRWYRNQCVAVGWAATDGYKLRGRTEGGRGWSTARNAINEMQVSDYVIVALRGNRVGRLGTITSKAIEDHEWKPLVPIGPGLPNGEMGRRVLVRWDLTVGPDNPDLVVQLPIGKTFSNYQLRPTVSRIEKTLTYDSLCDEMNKPANWVSLFGNFKYEKTLSDYIANYPNRLEDGLLPNPYSQIRERVFKDKTRLDVLLIDKQNRNVIVECKQNAPTSRDIEQLRHYMYLLMEEVGELPRGILVHGGASKLPYEIVYEARKAPVVEVISYTLEVHFRPSLSLVSMDS